MGNLFSIDNGFFNVMGKVFDIMVVSLLWFICCLPIVTIGPATTALYYSVVKSIRRERGYVSKEFFHSFKVNLKQGTITGLIFTFLAGVMAFNFYIVKQMDSKVGTILFGIYIVMSFLIYITAIYAFPNLSRFTLTIKGLFKNAIIMAISHLPSTILMAVIVGIAAFSIWYLVLVVIFVPGLACYLVSFIMEKILKKYTPEDAGQADAWYME
ncbi:YesL family protein [Anaerosporobacter sp.]